MSIFKVFVYGTLREGFGNYNSVLRGYVENITPARTKGMMFSTGGFPAVVRGGDDVIKGEVMTLKSEHVESTMRSLDLLEGYDPYDEDNSMYLRKQTTVILENGEKVEAYMYWWNLGLNNLVDYIDSGCWVKYSNERKLI